jgi:hypothetical protein
LGDKLFQDETGSSCPYYPYVNQGSDWDNPAYKGYDLMFQDHPQMTGESNGYANFMTSLVIMNPGEGYTSVYNIEWGYLITGILEVHSTFPQQAFVPGGLLYFGPGDWR